MTVPLFDPSRQSPTLQAAIHKAVERVLDHQQFILGPEVASFEKEIETSCLARIFHPSLLRNPGRPMGTTLGSNFDLDSMDTYSPTSKSSPVSSHQPSRLPRYESDEISGLGEAAHAVGMSSGTDAPLALFMAKKIGPTDAVITTPYTFFATAGSIHRVGAEIVFCDIEPRTYMMDPEKLRVLLGSFRRDSSGSLITPRGNRVRVIMPIHLFGICCDMDAIMALAKEYNLMVIEDAAQAIGADYPSAQGPQKAGTIAEMSYFSFYPTKNLGAAGDAGMAVCRDEKLAKELRSIRNHGMEERYYHNIVGGNFRLDGMQAAILRAKLPFLEEWSAQRRANAAIYRDAFQSASLLDYISLPSEPFADSGLCNHHIYHQYVVRILGSAQSGLREKITTHLAKKEIGYAIYYPVPLHLQKCFAYLNQGEGAYPEAERAAKETLALPIFPELREEEIRTVVKSIEEALRVY